MAAHATKPKISDGLVILATVCLMGAPTILGPEISHTLGAVLFYGGLIGMLVFIFVRWGWWLLGLTKSLGHSQEIGVDNKGGNYVGRDNSGPQTIYNAPVVIHHGPPPVRQYPGRVFVGESITLEYLMNLYLVPGRTSFQANHDVAPFIGKWKRVSGAMKDVVPIGKKTIRLMFEEDKSLSRTNRLFYSLLFMDFRESWFGRVLILKPGDQVKVIGQIAEVNSTYVTLNNCELEETT